MVKATNNSNFSYFSPAGWDWREDEEQVVSAPEHRGLVGVGGEQTFETGSEEGEYQLIIIELPKIINYSWTQLCQNSK